MSKLSYQRLLRIRYSQLSREEMLPQLARALSEVLSMPHPQREFAFVGWPHNIYLGKTPLSAINCLPGKEH